jgi:hypothetical protein
MVAILRNTLALVCLVLALAFAALGLRSAWTMDHVYWRLSDSKSFCIVSNSGRLCFAVKPFAFEPSIFHESSNPPTDPNVGYPDDDGKLPSKLWPQVMRWKSGPLTFIELPYWLPVVILLLVAPILATRRQFSLRAMIIATTVVAIVLGGVESFSRHEAQHRPPVLVE